MFLFFAALSGLITLSGCGGQDGGPERIQVTGMVKYDGVPVATGRITFVPDSSKGNSGPAGWATIQKGAFDTAGIGGKDPVAGHMKVVISGYGDPPAVKVETPEPLFPEYTTTAEIDATEKQNVIDIDVPVPEKKK